MAMTKYSIQSIKLLGIPTIKYFEVEDSDQFEKGKCYSLGIMDWYDFLYERKCTNIDSCTAYVKELRRVYGKDSKVFAYEYSMSNIKYLFSINGKGDYITDVEFESEEDKKEVEGWFDILSDDYDFIEPISGVISRDSDGRLMISSIG